MRAIQVSTPGGADALEVVDIELPEPQAGQVRVAVAAAGVNFRDVYERAGLYPMPLPFIAGAEGAGTVTALGPGASEYALGDRIAWKEARGSYAEQVIVDATEAIPVPDGVDDEVAAAVLLQGLTAHYLATSAYAVQPGDRVVIHAAAGGVGLLLTQIVKRRGGRVFGTVSTDEKAARAMMAGAETVSSYEAFAQAAQEFAGSEGIAAVYDGVGATTFDDGLKALRRRGTMVLFGASSGPVPPVDLQLLNARGSLFVTRPKLGDYTASRTELLARAAEVFGWILDGSLRVHIGGRYALADASSAHVELESRRTTGKLLLRPNE